MQQAKVIDVTRTFVPVDPNAYPETMHSTQGEDAPEGRTPIIAYMGANFLPTAYGQKSFFGQNSILDYTALDAKPDHIFIWQTETYKNIAFALCEEGIYIKTSSESGDWVQDYAYSNPFEDAFYEWFFMVIKNKLYIYRNNSVFYHVYETDPDEPMDLIRADVAPSFISMPDQIGMSRLGNRLCFWDGANAIAWSSADDYTDFTPAAITGANVTTFNSILGKISQIRPHGKDAICYSSGGVILLEVAAADTFLVKAKPLLGGAGVPLAKNSVSATPDNVHFCYSNKGIFKITDGHGELIVPEFFDYLKNLTNRFPYLHILNGRFLFFELIDQKAIDGNPAFGKVELPAIVEVDEPRLDEMDPEDDPATQDVCSIIAKIDDGLFEDQLEDDQADPNYPNALIRFPGTGVERLYTCYISDVIGPYTPITWVPATCYSHTKISDGVTTYKPFPSDTANKLANWTVDSDHKTARRGDAVWIDGKWTMARFIAYQTAIWKQQQKDQTLWNNEVLARFESSTQLTEGTTSCTPASDSASCLIGVFPKEYSIPNFGYNTCSFWLTRWCTKKLTITNAWGQGTGCSLIGTVTVPVNYYYNDWNGFGTHFATFQEAFDAIPQAGRTDFYGLTPGMGSPVAAKYDIHGDGYYVTPVWVAPAGATLVQISYGPNPTGTSANPPIVGYNWNVPHYNQVISQSSANIGETSPEGAWAAETAFCRPTHFKYIDTDGNPQIVAKASLCDDTLNRRPQSTQNPVARQVELDDPREPDPLADQDGSFCGDPYEETELIDGPPWDPDFEPLVYPDVEYLLQDGSIAPKYPTLVGAFVYDMHLKKWGKLVLDYKVLTDYHPINSFSKAPADHIDFGIIAGAFHEDGIIYTFDDLPEDAWITYGKFGYYRAGMSDIEEVRIDFRKECSGYIDIQYSLDGQSILYNWEDETIFVDETQVLVYPKYSAKWFNVKLSGVFDITGLQFKGFPKGRR
jgi:hypothetical protein